MLGDMISCFTLQQQALGLCSCNGRLYFDKILPVLNVSNILIILDTRTKAEVC